jgi:methylmalonyl-CoA mutase
LADFNGRATWTTNLLAAGGIAAIAEDGFTTAEQTGPAFSSSGAEVACICSSDQVYAQLGADAARSLKTAGAKRVYLAGLPGEREAELRAAGVDEFLFDGMDVLDALERLHLDLGLGRSGA